MERPSRAGNSSRDAITGNLSMAVIRLHTLFLVVVAAWCTQAIADQVLPPKAIRDDFKQLYESLQSAHFDLYISRSRADYDRAFDEVSATLNQPMKRADVIKAFQKFVALGNVAHARVESTDATFSDHLAAGGGLLPLSVRIIAERIFVVEYLGSDSRLVAGDEIVQIDNAPAATVLERLRAHLSADTKHLADTMMEHQFPQLLWQEFGERDAYTMVVRDSKDSEVNLRIEPVSLQQARENASLKKTGLGLSWSAREARILPDGTAYLRPGPFYNVEGNETWDTTGFAKFIDDSFRDFIESEVSNLLIDLRNNPGGDATFSDLMIAWFADRPFRFYSEFKIKVSQEAQASNATRIDGDDTHWVTRAYAREFANRAAGEIFSFQMPFVSPREDARFDGNVFVLVNRHSYSNAVTVAAILQDYGFATILGEETADLASTLGAMEHFSLQNTGIQVGFPKARIVRPNGDPARRGVVPDILIHTPVVETSDDPVLSEALALTR